MDVIVGIRNEGSFIDFCLESDNGLYLMEFLLSSAILGEEGDIREFLNRSLRIRLVISDIGTGVFGTTAVESSSFIRLILSDSRTLVLGFFLGVSGGTLECLIAVLVEV